MQHVLCLETLDKDLVFPKNGESFFDYVGVKRDMYGEEFSIETPQDLRASLWILEREEWFMSFLENQNLEKFNPHFEKTLEKINNPSLLINCLYKVANVKDYGVSVEKILKKLNLKFDDVTFIDIFKEAAKEEEDGYPRSEPLMHIIIEHTQDPGRLLDFFQQCLQIIHIKLPGQNAAPDGSIGFLDVVSIESAHVIIEKTTQQPYLRQMFLECFALSGCPSFVSGFVAFCALRKIDDKKQVIDDLLSFKNEKGYIARDQDLVDFCSSIMDLELSHQIKDVILTQRSYLKDKL
jgi:hypothetical protein